jgi:hypothetical protein
VTESEGFLSRWARRKQAAATSLEAEMDAAIAESATRSPPDSEPAAAQERASDAQPAVDLSALPAIESITAATDIRPFLAPGVPAELTRAALRRAWATDPQVRDFVGIAENQWDFTDPNGVPGFGPIGSLDDVRRMVAGLLGEDHDRKMSTPPATAIDAHPSEASASFATATAPEAVTTSPTTTEPAVEPHAPEAERVTELVAVQKDSDDAPAAAAPIRRAHGGALPR